jgi:cytochrome P450
MNKTDTVLSERTANTAAEPAWRAVFDPFDPTLVAEPHGTYKRLRDDDPVHWSPPLQAWVLTRREDVRAILADDTFEALRTGSIVAELARRSGRNFNHIIDFLDNTLFFASGDKHKRDRRTAAAIINRIPLGRLEPALALLADKLCENLGERGSFDVVADFADPFPQLVMGHILGLSDADIVQLGRYMVEATLVFDPIDLKTFDKIEGCLGEALALLARRLKEAADRQDDSPLAFILEQAGGPEHLAQAAALTLFLYRVGSETTIGLLGLAFRALLDDPALVARLRADPALIPRFVSEALRLESNVQRSVRVGREDRIVGGQLIRAGQRILLLLGSANRDPAVFPLPDDVSFEKREPDVAFGAGAHFCLGASLARLEGKIAVERFLALPPVERAGQDEWYAGRAIRRLIGLPVRCVTREADERHASEIG